VIIGIHHGGVTVVDLEAAVAHLETLSGWSEVHHVDAWHPLVAGTGAAGAALIAGPNGFLEVLQAREAAVPARRTVAQPGITHLSIQLPDMTAKNGQLTEMGIERHADPVELGTGFSYLYVRDREHNVVEIEGAGHAPASLGTWFSHVGIATADVDRLRSHYERLLGRPAVASIRFGGSEALDRVTALEDVEVTMTWVPAANANVELLQFHHPATPSPESRPILTPGVGHICLEVDDVAAAMDHATESGFRPVHGPTMSRQARVARVSDPDGNLIELIAFEREDDPLSLRNVESFTRSRDMDALLATKAGR
jgi:catechol 2,3-dioxygenase-like lactoylglutathione lyase family enzyme